MENLRHHSTTSTAPAVCNIPDVDTSGVTLVELRHGNPVADYQEAVELAKKEAHKHMEEFMLMSWFDRDRNIESPPNSTETAGDELTGYAYYGISHGATLKVDVEKGRFVFFSPRLIFNSRVPFGTG